MFVRCSHPNVSTFSGIVSATKAIFSPNVSGVGAMFVRRRHDVFESLQLLLLRRGGLAVRQRRTPGLEDTPEGLGLRELGALLALQ